MSLFTSIEGSVAIRFKGQYTEASLALCQGGIYAKLKGKYIRLKHQEQTSAQGHYWGALELQESYAFEAVSGNMVLAPKHLTSMPKT